MEYMTDVAVRLIAVGDLMLGDSSPIVGWGYGSKWPGASVMHSFAEVMSGIRGDIVFGNLEAVLTLEGLGAGYRSRNQMRCDPSVAVALSRCGFNTVSVANNHAMQHGEKGFRDTVEALESAGISVVGLVGSDGWCSMPVIRKFGTLSIGILGYCWRPRQYSQEAPGYAEGGIEAAESDVSRLSTLCDVVVVSLHWGDEFVSMPSQTQSRQAKRLLSAGASIILGHHPHVLQPFEFVEGRGVAYSLGNFAGDMLWLPELCFGGVLEASIFGADQIKYETHLVRVDSEYRVARAPGRIPSGSLHLDGDEAYSKLVAANLRKQQIALYKYAAKNLLRYSTPVLFDLIAQTAANKIVSLKERGKK